MPRVTPRFKLPELNFVETDAQTILKDLIARYEEIAGRTLADGDPVRLFLNTIAAEEVQLRTAFNLAARSNLLSYATGDYLDHLGNYVNTPRLPASKATTTVRFTLNYTVSDSYYVIPQGTIVSDGRYKFTTDDVAMIELGETYVDAPVTSTTEGEAVNGIAIGAIKQLNDPLPGIQSVSNLEVTSGGSDLEEDEAYAERIRLAPASFSVAGPHGAYVYHAMSYSASIIDVCVYGLTDEPGNVYIHPLLTGGTLPEQTFLDGLKEYLSADTIRPLTDFLIVATPTPIDYTIDLTWYLDKNDTDRIEQITKAVDEAVEKYRLWQQSEIGRDLNPDVLIDYLQDAGVKRVEIISPSFTKLAQSEVAQCKTTDVAINFGGTEEA